MRGGEVIGGGNRRGGRGGSRQIEVMFTGSISNLEE